MFKACQTKKWMMNIKACYCFRDLYLKLCFSHPIGNGIVNVQSWKDMKCDI